MDDVANLIPAHISVLLMLALSFLLGYNVKNGWREMPDITG